MRYRTIVVDPPWPYPAGFGTPAENHLVSGKARRTEDRGPIIRRSLPYPAMEIDEIKELPVSDLADVDCRLFLWATNRYVPSALMLLDEWGFSFRQLLVWDKTPNIPVLTGSVAPNAAEFLLVAVRGNPPRLGKWSSSVVRSRKPRSIHSQKPEVFLDLAEAVSPGPYLELFARRNRLGWDTFGNEVLNHVELPA